MAISLPMSVQRFNLLYYTIVVVVLGLPLWWYTTDTYRATLPHREIATLKENKLVFNIPVAFCFDAQEYQQWHVEKKLVSLKPFFLLKAPVPRKSRVLYDIIPEVTSKCSNRHPFVVQFTNKVKRVSKSEMSLDGYLMISMDKEISGMASDIVDYIELTHLHNHVLAVDNPDLHSHNQDIRNAMAVATSYNILVSLVNPDPAVCRIDHDVVDGTKRYLKPFLQSIENLANFTFQTQILRYVTLPTIPVKGKDHFHISESNLPHLINPVESKLGTSTTNDINLIIYLIEDRYSPLHIRTKTGDFTPIPSFLSPQFGAVLLYDQRNKTKIDHAETFSVLLPQLKQLLGLKASPSADITDKEKFIMESRATLVHVLKSIDTLNSLVRLTDAIPNMVIGDHIADLVAASVEGIKLAQAALEAHDFAEALHQASRARDAAETSFSDPSILALLYFPDDQKFAIYIPLFLPVGLPLLVAYLELIKERRKKSKSD